MAYGLKGYRRMETVFETPSCEAESPGTDELTSRLLDEITWRFQVSSYTLPRLVLSPKT
jgi:hypothetical protein